MNYSNALHTITVHFVCSGPTILHLDHTKFETIPKKLGRNCIQVIRHVVSLWMMLLMTLSAISCVPWWILFHSRVPGKDPLHNKLHILKYLRCLCPCLSVQWSALKTAESESISVDELPRTLESHRTTLVPLLCHLVSMDTTIGTSELPRKHE